MNHILISRRIRKEPGQKILCLTDFLFMENDTFLFFEKCQIKDT